MSVEQLKAFVEKVKSDTNLQEKVKAAASPEAAMEVAKAAGFSITLEDISSMQSGTEEEDLSDEELEGMAGGFIQRPGTGGFTQRPGSGMPDWMDRLCGMNMPILHADGKSI